MVASSSPDTHSHHGKQKQSCPSEAAVLGGAGAPARSPAAIASNNANIVGGLIMSDGLNIFDVTFFREPVSLLTPGIVNIPGINMNMGEKSKSNDVQSSSAFKYEVEVQPVSLFTDSMELMMSKQLGWCEKLDRHILGKMVTDSTISTSRPQTPDQADLNLPYPPAAAAAATAEAEAAPAAPAVVTASTPENGDPMKSKLLVASKYDAARINEQFTWLTERKQILIKQASMHIAKLGGGVREQTSEVLDVIGEATFQLEETLWRMDQHDASGKGMD